MATNRRPKAPTGTSPKGTFKFPKISEVDYGSKDFPCPEGKYEVQLILPAADPVTQEFVARLEELHQRAIANGEVAFNALKVELRKKLGKITVNALYTELLDETTEEPTGEISFKFKLPASGEYRNGPKQGSFWDARPAIFDKSGVRIVAGFNFRDRAEGETMADIHAKVQPAIWGGTVGKVSYEVGTDKDGEPGYFVAGNGMVGLSLKLKAVQVIDLVSAGERTAKDYGFGNEAGDDEDSDPGPDSTAGDLGGEGDF